MKKRILSILLVFAIALSSFCLTAAAQEEELSATIFFGSSELVSGTISANCYFSEEVDGIYAFIGYYNSDNILLDYSDYTLTGVTSQVLSIDIPESVTIGDFVKVVVLNESSLEPVDFFGINTLYCTKGLVTDVETVFDGMNERFYTLDSPEGSLSVSKRVVSVAEKGTPMRLKDMAEGEIAFEDYTQPRYRLEYTESSGIRVYYHSVGGAKQRWTMEEYNNGYAIAHSSGGYLAIENGEPVISDERFEWSLNYCGETPFTLMTSLDGFKLLTAEEQQRVIEICTSVGADSLPYSATSTGTSFLSKIEDTFTTLYLNRKTTSAEEQKAQILSAVTRPVMGELVDYHYSETPTFPGGDAVITQTNPIKTTHEMWDLVEVNGVIYSASTEHPYTGAPINCYRIDVTYKTSDTTQKVSVYCVDPNFANVQTAITALGKFPYAYRQHIKNMYVYLSTTTSTYNCGGEELFVRLTGTADEIAMIKGFAHELGHSNDYMANGDVNNRASHWSQGTVWQNAVTDDMATISTYGNSNSDEGFAEFARLYWLSLGNRDLQIGIKQLYPNRFASFQRMLTKIGCSEDVIY